MVTLFWTSKSSTHDHADPDAFANSRPDGIFLPSASVERRVSIRKINDGEDDRENAHDDKDVTDQVSRPDGAPSLVDFGLLNQIEYQMRVHIIRSRELINGSRARPHHNRDQILPSPYFFSAVNREILT